MGGSYQSRSAVSAQHALFFFGDTCGKSANELFKLSRSDMKMSKLRSLLVYIIGGVDLLCIGMVVW